MNYADKRKEFAETLEAPTLFVRFADSLAAHEQPLLMGTIIGSGAIHRAGFGA